MWHYPVDWHAPKSWKCVSWGRWMELTMYLNLCANPFLKPPQDFVEQKTIILKDRYSNVGLGSSLRGEPGLTTFRSQGCPWKIISGLRQSDTHRGVPGSAAYDKKKPSNCSKSVKKLTLLLAVSQKISAKLFRSWLLGRPRLLCC